MAKDEVKLIEKAFPEDYEYKELAGRSVKLSVKLTKIKEKKLPDLDDEFAQDVSQVALETAKTNLEQNKRGFATTPSQNVDALKVAVVTAQNNLRQAQLNFRNAAIRAPFAGQISAIAVSPGMYVGQNTAAFTLVSAQRLISFGVSPADAPALSAGKTIDRRLAVRRTRDWNRS